MSNTLTKTQTVKLPHQLVLPGVTIAYSYSPASSPLKPTLVFVHGWAGSATDWQKLTLPYLEQGFGILIYDAAGFGQSSFNNKAAAKNADYSLERYVQDLHALLAATGLERVRLVGHSWGGVVAMSYAAQFPDQVESLVAIGAAYFDPKRILHQILKWVSYLLAQILIVAKPWLRRSARLRRLAVQRYFWQNKNVEDIELVMRDALESDNQATVQTLLTGYQVQFRVVCPAIKCPTLYVGCQKDVVAPLAYVLAFVPLTANATSAVLPNCGHFPMLEQPVTLVKLMDEFFAGQ